MASNLSEIAERAKKEHLQKQEEIENSTLIDGDDTPIEPEEESEFEKEVDDLSDIEGYEQEPEEDEAVIMTAPPSLQKKAETNTPEIEDDEDEDLEDLEGEMSGFNPISGSSFEVTNEEILDSMPDIPNDGSMGNLETIIDQIRSETLTYYKKLTTQFGLGAEEAKAAATAKMKSLGETENIRYLKKNPQHLTVMIDKQNEDKLEFTQEEHEKMAKAKVIQLKVVEDVDLKTQRIKKVDKMRKIDVLQEIDTCLSNYSVPLPILNDYVKFKGSQIYQLVQAVEYDDTTLDETANRQASLVYNQLIGGSNITKFDENGNTIMSYKDFINKYPYHDLQMGMYGILVASSMEEVESRRRCPDCGRYFDYTYNVKSLLSTEGLPDGYLERFEKILEHKTNSRYLKEMYEHNFKTHIVESPITGNRYHLNSPTIARALGLFRNIDQNDKIVVNLTTIALFIDKMFIYDRKQQDYLPVEEDEYKLLYESLERVPQEELDIIAEYIKKFYYVPKFVIKTKCKHCGFDIKEETNIMNMIFQRARGSSVETQM